MPGKASPLSQAIIFRTSDLTFKTKVALDILKILADTKPEVVTQLKEECFAGLILDLATKVDEDKKDLLVPAQLWSQLEDKANLYVDEDELKAAIDHLKS